MPDFPLPALDDLNMGFEIVEGFSRPDWKGISAFIKDRVPKEDWRLAWDWVVENWLKEMAGDLGGDCQVCPSHSFFCLSDLESVATNKILNFAESAVDVIRGYLK